MKKTMKTHDFCWVELTTDNAKDATGFYRALFGWEFAEPTDTPVGPYYMSERGDQAGIGMMNKPMEGMPSAWLPYVLVESVEGTVAKAKELGSEIVVPPTPVEGHGIFSVIKDPQGAHLGIWETQEM